MKYSSCKLTSALLTTTFVLALFSKTASAVTPFPMSTGDYFENFDDIANWTDNFAAGAGAAAWSSVPIAALGSIPNGRNTTVSTATFQTTSTGAGVQRGGLGANPGGTIVLLSPGPGDNTNAMAIDLNLDFTGRTAGTLSFDWSGVANSTGDRAASIRVYTTTDGATYTELVAADVLNVSNNVASSGSITSVALPITFDASSTAKIRFYAYNGSGGSAGSRAKIALDNIFVTSGPTPVAPGIASISPSSITTNAGSTVSYVMKATGSSPLSYFWYKETGSTTSLIAGATSGTLTLANVLGTDAASYQGVASNATTLTATSAVVTLTVTGDPTITRVLPGLAYGLLNNSVTFTATATGTSPTYQWYYANSSSNITAVLNNGVRPSGSTVAGATSSQLTLGNLQTSDPTNFAVVATTAYGSATGFVSLVIVTNTGLIAYWDFNGSEFTNTTADPFSISNPVPYVGAGSAFAVGFPNTPGTTPFSGSVDPADGIGFALNGHLPNFSWGTSTYPSNGLAGVSNSNKLHGVQFNASTLGAKNITVSYDSRPSGTASDYERLQYTTNGGGNWIDFPTSTTFGPNHGTTYSPYSYSLAGFPGVANNPNFGIRIVAEVVSTATYGISPNTNYLGANNTYGVTGTLTYDRLAIGGDAITNNNAPPSVAMSSPTDIRMPDYVSTNIAFTVADTDDGAASLNVSAVSLAPSSVNGTFVFSGSGATRTLTITPGFIPDQFDAAPILVTVTDPHGDVGVTWFLLTLSSVNLAPTNGLVSVKTTNTLANAPLTIPFTVGDDRTPVGSLVPTGVSDNTTLVPNGNITFGGSGANRTVTITPAAGQVGLADIYVTLPDNDSQEPRSTTATIAFMVRPNTNVVGIDYFGYDNPGALDFIASNFWQHLSGTLAQMQVGSGAVTVDTLNNTENMQFPLLGSPYASNTPAVLYASFVVNQDPNNMPRTNGTYFAVFNDGSGNTANVECHVITATNGAASGNYRLGIANTGTLATNAVMFPQDLVPGTDYAVVVKLVCSNAFSTLWVSPINESSPNAADSTTVSAGSRFNISDFELRESGQNGGSVRVSKLKVGKTFDSVFPSLVIQSLGGKTVVTWSDPSLVIQSSSYLLGPYSDVVGATTPYTNSSPNSILFYRLKP